MAAFLTLIFSALVVYMASPLIMQASTVHARLGLKMDEVILIIEGQSKDILSNPNSPYRYTR